MHLPTILMGRECSLARSWYILDNIRSQSSTDRIESNSAFKERVAGTNFDTLWTSVSVSCIGHRESLAMVEFCETEEVTNPTGYVFESRKLCLVTF